MIDFGENASLDITMPNKKTQFSFIPKLEKNFFLYSITIPN